MSTITDLLKQDININILGKRNTGKSHLTKYIIKNLFIKSMIDYVIVISATLYTGYWDCIPKKYQYYPKDAEIAIKKVLTFQKAHKNENIHALIILDDCLGGIKFNDNFYTSLYTTCRHAKTTIITIAQYPKKLPPLIRDNADFLFILKQNGKDALESIHLDYFYFMSNEQFFKYINDNTNDYKFIMIDLRTKSTNDNDIYKIGRAPADIGNFTLEF